MKYPRLKAPSAMACIAGVEMFRISAFLAASPEERRPLAPFRAVTTPVKPKMVDDRGGMFGMLLVEKEKSEETK